MTRDVEGEILHPLTLKPGKGYVIVCLVLGLITAGALCAWGWQIYRGLGVTGMKTPVFWGLYLVNFVFFIGVSHAGTLISSILRITNTGFRRPFTRLAEAITVFSLPFGAMSVIVDLGRPDRALNILTYPHFTSAILWDVLCITTYLITSIFYFYMALVPDVALCRDRLTKASPVRQRLYRMLALGWMGTESQQRILNRIMTGMSIFLFALVITVHTNVSFAFGLTTKPGWASAIISPFFVLGAIYSGVACVVIFAAVIRKLFHFEEFMTEQHFKSMGKFLLVLCCFWFYGMIVEHLFGLYHGEPVEGRLLYKKLFGSYAPVFWTMFVLCFPIPLIVLAMPRWRTIRNLVIVSVIINVGMWLERFIIIVPSGTTPYLPWGDGDYTPSVTEWMITAGWVSGFILLVLLFVRIFPSLTIWEVKEEIEEQEAEALHAR